MTDKAKSTNVERLVMSAAERLVMSLLLSQGAAIFLGAYSRLLFLLFPGDQRVLGDTLWGEGEDLTREMRRFSVRSQYLEI